MYRWQVIGVNAIKLTAIVIGFFVVGHCPARAGELVFRCVNSASHAAWELKVNPADGTADGFPAKIGTATIAWRDATRGGDYELDRASGQLTFTNASSMGGYMLFHHCQQLK